MGKSILEIGLAFTLVLVKIGQLESKAVEYVYTGDACECPRDLPYEVGIPVIKANLPPTPKEHNYRIEIPSIHRTAKLQYSLDFQVEEPKPPVTPPKLPGAELIARVDRITVPKPDCQTLINKPCTCHMAEKNYPFYNSCPLHDAMEYKESAYSLPINFLRLKRDVYDKQFKQLKDVSKTDKKKIKQQNTWKKTKRIASIKHNLKKREITAELGNIQKDYSKTVDMNALEILQYMPEASSPDFAKERCFACDNSNNKKQNQNNYQYNNNIITSCQPKVTPVQMHCKPNYVEYVLGFPVSYEPRNNVLYNQPEQRIVYDRLGHKYKENNGSLKLIHPTKEEKDDPIVGNTMNYDRNMDNLIRDIVNSHPEFMEASDHGDGVLTTSIESQRHDTRAYVRRLIGDRMSKMLAKRHGDHYQTDYNYEDDSYENLKYSSDLMDNRSEQLNLSFEENELNALHLIDNQPLTETEETMKNNVHFLKFKKDGKILQILTSDKNETYHDDV